MDSSPAFSLTTSFLMLSRLFLLSFRNKSTPIIVITVSTTDIEEASGQFLVVVSSRDIMLPSIMESLPPTSIGITYDPKAGMNVKSIEVARPPFILGSNTLKKACALVAPRSLAASRSEKSNFSIDE